MTQDASADGRRWFISARSRGELLTSSARADGAELVMVGVPSGYSSEEVESWLRDLMGMALETSSGEDDPRPIPALLHHLLTGLLFSHAELWDGIGDTPPSSLAFVRAGSEVAFGWVNAPPPDLWIDDHRANVEWVRIRDQDSREACALSIDGAQRVRVHFTIEAGATVDAAWVPEPQAAGAEATPAPPGAEPMRATSTIARAVGARAGVPEPAPGVVAPSPAPAGPPAARNEPDGWTVVYEGADSAPPAEPPPPPSGGGHWWSSMVGWMSGGRTAPEAAEPGTPPAEEPAADDVDRIPPTPEAAEITERTVPLVEPVAPSPSLREIELAPLAPEEPEAGGSPAAPGTSPPAPALELESARLEPRPGRRTAASQAPSASPAPPAPPASPAPPAGTAARPAGAPASGAPAGAAPPAPKREGRAPRRPPARRPAAAPAAAPPVPAPSTASVAPTAPAPAERPREVPAPASAVVATPARAPEFVEPDLGPRRATEPPAEGERVPRRPSWADAAPMAAERPIWARPWVWVVGVAILFLIGWVLGDTQSERTPLESGPVAKALRSIGIGGARFDATLESQPTGAWVTVDGQDIARRTPTHVELTPGIHHVTLSFAEMGSATFEVRGTRNEKVALKAPLWGSLEVYSGDGTIPVAVAVDGEDQGLAPVTVDKLSPGTHEVRFSGPGLQPWGQTIQIKVKEKSQMLARAVTSPATGILDVRSLWTDSEGSEPLTGATVYIDGDKAGVTPLTLELPRGPHSVRIESRGEKSPVQVIDLPGGNQRFANFELGLGIDQPTLEVLNTPIRVPLDQPSVLSAALQGVSPDEVREMWLHIRQPDGAWRRYAMNVMRAPGGVVGTSVFPNTYLDSQGRTPFYVSASNTTGDEFFSELMTATEQAGSHH